MMKRLFASMLTLTLVFGLAACGGSAKKETSAPETEAAPQAEAVGETVAETEASMPEEEAGTYYELSYMKQDEMEIGEDILRTMHAGYILLRDDGTGYIMFMGEASEELTWDEDGITSDEETIPYTMDGDVLRMEKDGSIMEFTKTTYGELTAEPEALKPVEGYDPDHRQGYYKLSEIESNGAVTSGAMLEAMGMSFYMVLEEDGTGTFVMFGQPVALTWDDSAITIEGEAAEYIYLDGAISIVQDTGTMELVYAGTVEDAPEIETETEATE